MLYFQTTTSQTMFICLSDDNESIAIFFINFDTNKVCSVGEKTNYQVFD